MTSRAGTCVSGKNVLVLGLGVTGREVARSLASRGASVLASDEKIVPADVEEVLSSSGVDVESGGHHRASVRLDSFDLVVPSPGISPARGFLAEALRRGASVVSELDLGMAMTDARIVAVTGTNGKTTVCRLAERIGREAGFAAYACGNTEVPFLKAIDDHRDADVFVVEASSFRLAFCETFKPHVAVITNLAPDHLDWHPSFEHYRSSKARIAARQGPGDLFLYPDAQPDLAELAPADGPLRVAFSQRPLHSDGAWLEDGSLVVKIADRHVRAGGVGSLMSHAPHFALDAAAAAAAMAFIGAGAGAIERALDGFAPDSQRLELIGHKNGIPVYDDSVSANVHATLAALRRFGGGVVLIAGGRNKGLDLSPLAAEAPRLRSVVAIGEAAGDLEGVFASVGVPTNTVGSMAEAVVVALESAKEGDVVLLSPACASHDMFANYRERGRAFREACREMGVA